MPPRTYTKAFLPLESNPEIFTSLAHNLGLSPTLEFTEVYDLDDDVSGEVLAYVLAFPTDEGYDERNDQDDEREIEDGSKEFGSKERDVRGGVKGESNGEGVLWLRQTIHNACGLYALLHATCNGEARKYISIYSPSSLLPFPSSPVLRSTITNNKHRTKLNSPNPPHHTLPPILILPLLIPRSRNLLHRGRKIRRYRYTSRGRRGRLALYLFCAFFAEAV
jgi:hypothetical protein